MSVNDLLTKEKEIHKLNYELQLKMHDVMKEVDSIIYDHVSDNLFSNTDQLYLIPAMKEIKQNYPRNVLKINKQSKESIEIAEISGENVNNIEILLKKNDNLGNKAVINLLKSKIDMLYKGLQAMQFEYNKKFEYFKELEIENKKHNEIQSKLHHQIGSLNDTIIKLENTNSDILLQCQILSKENVSLKKDLDGHKKEIKILNQQSNNHDIRLNRSLESSEKLKNALKCSQIEEKELRNQIRKLQENKKLIMKNFEKQRLELIQVFQKQMLLIDNLKKQNEYLMVRRQICITEEDFINLLEWKL